MKLSGNLRKMTTELYVSETCRPVEYGLPVGDENIPLNQFIGKHITLDFEGEINCIACGRKTNKSFSQGYCYPCMRSLPECDMCIMRPETCHFAQGTCRDETWAKSHCLQDHIVYLANSSGLKVGITRQTQIPTRWIDQGATQALPIFRVKERLHSGLLEVILKQHISDRTDWRKMLKGDAEVADLAQRRDELINECAAEIGELIASLPTGSIEPLDEPEVVISYPVEQYPAKVSSLNFDKTPQISSQLLGVKGQYLIFEAGVINIRKFAGYNITIST